MEEEVERLLRVKQKGGIQGNKTFLIKLIKVHINLQRLNQYDMYECLPGFKGIYYAV